MTRGPRTPRPGAFPLRLDRVASPTPAPNHAATTPLRPQRPLQQAAADAARHSVPSGLGLDSSAVRLRMVRRLQAEGLGCPPVLAALASVERHRFVDSALAPQAYEDTALPIGLGQTISKPSVVARMLALLFEGDAARQQGHLGRVLEIGSGCGYQTALLAAGLARSVLSIERLRELHDKARENLAATGRGARGQADVRLVHGDGRLGHVPWAPYTSIVAAAGGEDLPPAWLEQLAVGGRLVAPVVDPSRGGQALLVVDRNEHGLRRHWLDGVHFVPLESGAR